MRGEEAAGAVTAEYGHAVTGGAVKPAHVGKALIHAARQQRAKSAADEQWRVDAAEILIQSVTVADAYGCDLGVMLKMKRAAVAEAVPRPAHFHGRDVRAP